MFAVIQTLLTGKDWSFVHHPGVLFAITSEGRTRKWMYAPEKHHDENNT
jgi:hypothetical protein